MEQHTNDSFRPIPGPDALEKLVLKNTSKPFDDNAALAHLRAVDEDLVEADARLIDALLA